MLPARSLARRRIPRTQAVKQIASTLLTGFALKTRHRADILGNRPAFLGRSCRKLAGVE